MMLPLARALLREARAKLDKVKVLRHFSHIHGPNSFESTNTEFFVVSLIKNVECYVDEFVAHYEKLGAKGIVFIDNGSTDATIDLAKQYPSVSIFQCPLPFLEYEARMRRYFLQHYFSKQWVLCCDIDEHFEYPYSNSTAMDEFLGYLNVSGYTAVTACMLDVYAKTEASVSAGTSFRDLYTYFDFCTITQKPYPIDWYPTRGNVVPTGLEVFSGGVRSRIMPHAGDCLLTKHPLMFIDETIIPFSHPHYCARAKIADVTCVLLHYKFIEGFGERATAVLTEVGPESKWGIENAAYVDFLRSGGGTFFHQDSTRYVSVESLAAIGSFPSSKALLHYLARDEFSCNPVALDQSDSTVETFLTLTQANEEASPATRIDAAPAA